MTRQLSIANFIIGGADKAGTTSIFTYLSEHPAVSAAINKETDFFRHEFTGDIACDRQAYSRYFDQLRHAAPVVMEASPAYLGEADVVAPRMARLVPDARLLFILRNPVERLYSSYNFHVGKLTIPESVSFEEYVDSCLAFDRGASRTGTPGIEDWCLKSMRVGRYVDFLSPFLQAFPGPRVHVMFFEQLSVDPRQFMTELSDFLEIEATPWGQHQFEKENVTISVSNKTLHRLAMLVNQRGERFLRRRPAIKRTLRDVYRKVNRARQGYEPMSPDVRRLLYQYYHDSNGALRELLARELPESWAGSATESPRT